ncbi:MAG: WS/DGAT/MGAT family O-acyltransferase [Solirubrobacterales bacterium]
MSTSQLSPLDAAFLELEEADEAAHMHIGWALVFDPVPGGERPSLEQLRDQVRERLEALPRFRRRLSSPRVGRFSLPAWEPAPDLDPGELIRRATLPAPGGEAELMEWLGDFFSHRLDRSRPLWETTLLEGLEGGRWALVSKVHHCLIDGISGAEVATILLDVEAEPAPEATTLADIVASPQEGDSDLGRVSKLRGMVGGAVRGGVDAVRHPRNLLSQSWAMAETLVRDELNSAPHTSLNETIGATRRFAAVEVPLEEAKRVKRELGGTVNDVVLAATAGGLRRLFEARGEDVDHIRAMVPVSVRAAGESLALGNKVSSLFVDVAVAEPDPLLRYRKIAAASRKLKSGNAVAGTDAVIKLAGLTPPAIQSIVARLMFTPRLFNVTITNVPASPITLYCQGAPMRRVVPLVPIFSGHAVGVAVVSYDGALTFGLNADRDAVPDLEAMRAGIEESLAELRQLAAASPAAA